MSDDSPLKLASDEPAGQGLSRRAASWPPEPEAPWPRTA
jgi:hypothetical protein